MKTITASKIYITHNNLLATAINLPMMWAKRHVAMREGNNSIIKTGMGAHKASANTVIYLVIQNGLVTNLSTLSFEQDTLAVGNSNGIHD